MLTGVLCGSLDRAGQSPVRYPLRSTSISYNVAARPVPCLPSLDTFPPSLLVPTEKFEHTEAFGALNRKAGRDRPCVLLCLAFEVSPTFLSDCTTLCIFGFPILNSPSFCSFSYVLHFFFLQFVFYIVDLTSCPSSDCDLTPKPATPSQGYRDPAFICF